MITIGAATDYIYSLAQQAVAGVTVEKAVAVDGWATTLYPIMFHVGLSQPPDNPIGDSTSSRSWAALGAAAVQEDFTVPACIDVRMTGTQKQVRDIAEGLFDSFWTLLATDLTLDGLLKEGRYAEITDLTSTPSNVGTATQNGRRQLISFGVHCQNLTRT